MAADLSKNPVVTHLASVSMKVRSASERFHFTNVTLQREVALSNGLYAASDIAATAAMSWEFYRNKGGVKS